MDLRMSRVRSSVASAPRRLLRVLLLLGSALPAKTGRSRSLLILPPEFVDDGRPVRKPHRQAKSHSPEAHNRLVLRLALDHSVDPLILLALPRLKGSR